MQNAWQVLVGLFAFGLCTACGGSSSETPFPLEPDFARLDAGGPAANARYVVFTGGSSRSAETDRDGAPPDDE